MSNGGGFCELHGPFDPPYTTCPYCQMEQDQRQVFGPPEPTRPHTSQPDRAPAQDQGGVPDDSAPRAPADADAAAPANGDFVRRTVEPEARRSTGDVTEVAPRPDAVDDMLEPDGAQAGPQPLGWLIVREPLARRGAVLAVRPNQVIGREGDVQWDDPRLSRQHARVTFEPVDGSADDEAAFHLWPFGPTNPVYVNGEAIRGATPLHENDTIMLGTTVFVFKVLLD